MIGASRSSLASLRRSVMTTTAAPVVRSDALTTEGSVNHEQTGNLRAARNRLVCTRTLGEDRMAQAKQKPKRERLPQLSVLVSEETMRRLAALQDYYKARDGSFSNVTQAETIERALRDTAVSVGIEQKKGGR